MRNYTSCTIDEVLALIRQGESKAYGELFKLLRPIILNEAEMYRDKGGDRKYGLPLFCLP